MASVRQPGKGAGSGPLRSGHHGDWRVHSRTVFLAVWLHGTLVNGGLLVAWPALDHPSLVVGSAAVLLQAAATAALLWWLGPVPTATLAAAQQTRRGALALATGLACLRCFLSGRLDWSFWFRWG
jgi:hypothetical protein